MLGWKPAEFWAATTWEYETALLTKLEEAKPPAWSDDQVAEFFDRAAAMQHQEL